MSAATVRLDLAAMQRAFDALAETWDRDHGPLSVNAAAFAARTLLLKAVFGRRLRPRVLDVGCGTGQQLLVLASDIGTGVGIDLSPRMIAAAQSHVVGSGRHRRLSFLVTPAENLAPSRLGRFDLIYFAGSLEHMHDPTTVLTSTRRLLRRDGQVVVFMRTPRHGSSDHLAVSDSGPIPPVRHLCPGDLSRVARRAGLRQRAIVGYSANSVVRSRLNRQGPQPWAPLTPRIPDLYAAVFRS